MNVEYVNSFIEAAKVVLKNTTNYDTNLGRVYLRNSSFKTDEIVIVVGVTGNMKGQVMLCMNKSTMLNISSAMMKNLSGQEITEVCDLSASAISELCNMILGNSATYLFEKGLEINISPPSIFSGMGIEISNKYKTLCIPIQLNDGSVFEINISAEETIAA